ncbi:hypothetical protein R83H12_02858 [Fibrobacteria bacterium R8-3-H12]
MALYPKMASDYGIVDVSSSSSIATPSSSSIASSSSLAVSSSSLMSSSSSEDITPVLSVSFAEKNMEGICVYFDGSKVLIKKTLSNGKARIFDLKGKELWLTR